MLVKLTIILLSTISIDGIQIKETENVDILFDQKIKRILNVSVDPCDNFYDFACGNWNNLYPIPPYDSEFSPQNIVEETLNNQILHLIENEVEDQRIKDLYKTCMDQEYLREDSDRLLIQIFNELGGFPALENKWNSSKFDLAKVLGKVMQYNPDILIKIDLLPMENDSLHLLKPESGLSSEEYYSNIGDNKEVFEAYKSYLVELIILLGGDQDRVEDAVEKIINFEIELLGVFDEDFILFTAEEYREWESSDNEMKVTFSKILQLLLSDICSQYQNIFYSESIFTNLTTLLSETEPDIIANYILIQFVLRNVDYLDKRYKQATLRFKRVLYGVEEWIPRQSHCIKITRESMYFKIYAKYLETYFKDGILDDIRKIGNELQQSYLDFLGEILKPKKAVDIMKDRFDKIHWNIGYPSEIDLNEVAENSHKELEIIPDYFLATMLNVAKSLTKDKFNVHGQLMKNSLWFFESELHFSINTYYDGNNVIVPAEFLLNPYYVKEFEVFNLATIGAILGHELAHSITEFLQPYDESKKCIVEHYNGFTFRDIGDAVDGDKSFSIYIFITI